MLEGGYQGTQRCLRQSQRVSEGYLEASGAFQKVLRGLQDDFHWISRAYQEVSWGVSGCHGDPSGSRGVSEDLRGVSGGGGS